MLPISSKMFPAAFTVLLPLSDTQTLLLLLQPTSALVCQTVEQAKWPVSDFFFPNPNFLSLLKMLDCKEGRQRKGFFTTYTSHQELYIFHVVQQLFYGGVGTFSCRLKYIVQAYKHLGRKCRSIVLTDPGFPGTVCSPPP